MIGSTLAQYQVTAALGEGGMGQVWRAEDSKLGREVALKVLPEEFAQDPERMARFEREARVLANLNHPNIATLYGLETTPVFPSERSGPPSVIPSEAPCRVEGSPEVGERSSSQQAPRNFGGPSTSASPGDASAQDDRRAVTFLAMELVEGEDLSESIKRGPIPVDEAVAIALQISEALEAAHDQGIVHRDLKPANIKLRPDGTVKVLDFGLAKAWESDHGDSSLSLSPTVTSHATAAGLILGTAAYMSPEQARGTAVDQKADIWSFGVVLWEMLTGRKLFEGETVSDVLASVLKEAPDLDALPADLPPRVRILVGRCLEKGPRQRLQAIGEARIALEDYRADPEALDLPMMAEVVEAVPQPAWRKGLPWALALVAFLAAGALGLGSLFEGDEPGAAIRFQVPPPEGGGYHLDPYRPGPVVVSPDGQSLAFAAWDTDGEVRIFVRELDEVQSRVLAGTEDAQYPFWSPDSTNLGFFADGKLKKVSASGGQPLTLCDAPDGKGGSWGAGGVILFTPSDRAPIQRVSQLGGEPVDVTTFDDERGDFSHRHPRFLPDGKTFLYLAKVASMDTEGPAIVAASLDGGEEKMILRSPAAGEYASGHLLFLRERTLMAQPFDKDALELSGEPFPVADTVVLIATGTAQAVFSASQTGVLAFQGGVFSTDLVLRWRGRDGSIQETIGEPAGFTNLVDLSPNGDTALVQIETGDADNRDLWVVELDRKLRTRFTFSPDDDVAPVLSPDGSMVVWAVQDAEERTAIHRKSIGGSGDGEVLAQFDKRTFPSSWHPSGDSLLVVQQVSQTPNNPDIFSWSVGEGSELEPWLATEFVEYSPDFSADGRWVVYGSNESGNWEIYVAPFPGPGRKWQVSVGGGAWPLWRGDGREILYMNGEDIMTVAVEDQGSGLAFGQPKRLFKRVVSGNRLGFDVTDDGERFLMVEPVESGPPEPVTVVVNWPAAIEAQR